MGAPRKVARRARTVGTLVLLMAIGLLVTNGISVVRNLRKLRAPAPGRLAPAFSVRGIDGRQHQLSDYRGKVVVLDFWASWCGPCREKFPLLEKLQDQFGWRGLQVLAVNIESQADAAAFMDKRDRARQQSGQGRSGVIALFDDAGVAFSYGVQTIPYVVVVGRDGSIVHVHAGAGGTTELREKAVVALAAP